MSRDAPGSAEHAVSGPDPGRRRIGMLGPLLVVALLAAGLLGWQLLEQNRLVEASTDAERAGRAAATSMLSYDYTTLDEDFAWVGEDGTKTFAQAFAGTVDDVKGLALATSAHSEVRIRDSGVHLMDESHATVLVAADQKITEPAKAAQELQRWRIRFTLVKQDGRWLVDRLDLL